MTALARRLAAAIEQRLDARHFLPLLAVALAATAYGLGPSLERIVALTGRRFVDMQPGIAPQDLVAQLALYTPETVRWYLAWLAFDFAWPLVTYTTMLFMAAWLVARGGTFWRDRLWLFVAVACATVAMDWAENCGFAWLAAAPPPDPAWLAALSVGAHRAKLALNFAFNLMFFALLGSALVHAVRRQPTQPGADGR